MYNANILNDAAQGPNPSIYDPPGFEDTSSILLSRLVNKMGTAIMAIGWHDGIIKYANNQACRDLGKQCNDLPGRHYREIFRPEFIPLYESLQSACADENEHDAIYYLGEKTVWEQVSAILVHLENGPCTLLTVNNISGTMLSQYMSDNAAYFDNLLKLPNGAKLEEDINALANVEPLALLYIKINGLREVNNLYGWQNGDNLLVQIRDWLIFSESRRAQMYRLEDGIALLGRGVSMEDVIDRAESIEHRFKYPWTLLINGRNMSLFCSIKLGIVYGKYMKNEMRNILLRTIEAAQDRDGYVIYDEKVDSDVRRTIKIRDSLINCVYNGMKGFELNYQPIVETKTGRWVAVEALCRWTAPDGTRVSPDVFIRFAEQLGLIGELDAWVRKKAMQQCVALNLHTKPFILDINFSPTQKISGTFLEGLRDTLAQTGFPANKLNLEVVESAKMPFDDENLCGLQQIQNEGIYLSLDDFGTGYSSLENLIRVSARFLKLDRLFLDDIEHDDYKQYLLQALVGLARHLDMQVIAEGVETEEQLNLLQGYDVDFIQGYLISRPLSFDQLRENVDLFA